MVFKKYKFCAFSLVELMISLITISLITAAFAPVVTKKLNSSSIIIGGSGGSSGELTMDCSKFGASCGLCYTDKCVSCVKSCADNEALDVANCNCITCSSKYSDACLKCDIENCSKCTSVNYLDSGACVACEAGYYCDGTTKEPCPQGYYCSGGTKTACPAGKYNDVTGKSSSSDCKSCASGTYSSQGASSCTTSTTLANCSTYSTTSNACTACNSGYELKNAACVASKLSFTYNGSHLDTTNEAGKQKIYIKSSGTFVALNDKDVTILVVGGGGAGNYNYGGGGGGGYCTKTTRTLVKDASYTVTIGSGATSNQACYGAAGSGGQSKFGSITASGGTGGYVGTSKTCAVGGGGSGQGDGGAKYVKD